MQPLVPLVFHNLPSLYPLLFYLYTCILDMEARELRKKLVSSEKQSLEFQQNIQELEQQVRFWCCLIHWECFVAFIESTYIAHP